MSEYYSRLSREEIHRRARDARANGVGAVADFTRLIQQRGYSVELAKNIINTAIDIAAGDGDMPAKPNEKKRGYEWEYNPNSNSYHLVPVMGSRGWWQLK